MMENKNLHARCPLCGQGLTVDLCQLIQSNGMKNQIHALLKENKCSPTLHVEVKEILNGMKL